MYSLMLWVELLQVLHVPSVGQWSSVSFLQAIGAGSNYLGHDIRALPLGGQLVQSVTLGDASEYQVADHEGLCLY
jgi:hypothetical protein